MPRLALIFFLDGRRPPSYSTPQPLGFFAQRGGSPGTALLSLAEPRPHAFPCEGAVQAASGCGGGPATAGLWLPFHCARGYVGNGLAGAGIHGKPFSIQVQGGPKPPGCQDRVGTLPTPPLQVPKTAGKTSGTFSRMSKKCPFPHAASHIAQFLMFGLFLHEKKMFKEFCFCYFIILLFSKKNELFSKNFGRYPAF